MNPSAMRIPRHFRTRLFRYLRLPPVRWHRFLAVTALVACMTVFVMAPPAIAETPVQSAAEIDYPPFSIVDEDGNASGFSVELMRAALAAMGREVAFRTGPWPEVRRWLEKGRVQALPLVGRTPEREVLFDFTFPYMSLHGAIVVRKDTTDINTMADLRGRRVAVMEGDNAEEFLRRKARGIDIHTTETFEQALHELSSGRHDAVVIQRIVALRILHETGLSNLRVIDRPVENFRQDFCFAVKEGDSETLALLNEGLAIVVADGTYRHLHAKWFAAMELPSNRHIVVGGDHNYPPYEFLDENGRPAGYNVDLTRAIAQELGLDIEIRLGPWSEIREALARGEIDAIQGMLYSRKREMIFDFTPPHTVNHYISVVRTGGGPAPETVGDLAGRDIVVQRGDIMHDFVLEKGLEDRFAAVDAQEDALRELAEGMHDCALVSRMTALYWIDKYEWSHLLMGQHPLLSPEYSYAVPNNHKALLAHFSEGLRLLEESGEYRRINEKWLGVYREGPESLINALRYFVMILVPLGLILLGVFLWSWSLRRQVASRTEKLRESEEFQRAMIACSPVALYSIDTKGNVLAWNASAERIFGWTAEEVIGRPLPIVPEDRQEEFAALRHRLTDGGAFSGVEVIRQKKDGSRFPARLSAATIHDSKGQTIGIMGSLEDITERKQAEERIAHLNRVLLAIRDVNQLIVREKDREELIRKTCRILVDNRSYASVLIVLTGENDRPEQWAEAGMGDVFTPVHAALEKGELPSCCNYARSMEKTALIKDRKKICGPCPIALACAEANTLCARLVHNGETFGYIAAALEKSLGMDAEEQTLFAEMTEDIAYALRVLKMEEAREKAEKDREFMENQLHQARKMEAVGRLAGGVAHDYNNMLSVITGYTELAMDKVDTGEGLYTDLQEIHNAARRSTDITRQLLAFARKQTILPKVLDINETVEKMLQMLRRLIGEDIDLHWLPGPDLWPVKIDPVQIDQMLANLCVNARDAINGVGRITIETHNIVMDESYLADHAGFTTGEFVLLAVSDNGRGMEEETRDNIFEPFFTTKEAGKGTGLGMATVFGIVKQNNGFINVYSEPETGTTFKIYLPRHKGAEKRETIEPTEEILPGRGETVLLVEDEPAIMKMSRMMLARLGYTVLSANTPSRAMQLAGEHAAAIRLLITDVVMPEMNGRDLAEQIHGLCPDLKILFMSGYTSNVIAHQGVLDADVNFIQKPFSMKALSVKIRTILDEK
ncbi:MAG: transporter substrate-binding domain-containing protein [Desulfosalsimonadaceae bacterium]